MKRYIKSANGFLYNNDHGLYYDCLTDYRVEFADGVVMYVRAESPFDAEMIAARYDDDDNEIKIISIMEDN